MTAACAVSSLIEYQQFSHRHLAHTEADVAAILAVLDEKNMDDFIDKIVPQSIRAKTPLALSSGLSEHDALARLQAIAQKNVLKKSMIGLGYADTRLPNVILRNVLENPSWYTAYTPYQPEIAQGRLEALLNFQQMVMDLTGLPLANASLLDEATAAAEAMAMARRISTSPSRAFFVSENAFPQTKDVLKTRAHFFGFE